MALAILFMTVQAVLGNIYGSYNKLVTLEFSAIVVYISSNVTLPFPFSFLKRMIELHDKYTEYNEWWTLATVFYLSFHRNYYVFLSPNSVFHFTNRNCKGWITLLEIFFLFCFFLCKSCCVVLVEEWEI